MRKTVGYTLSEYKRSEEIMRELQISQITEFIKYRQNWKEHIYRISSFMLLKKDLKVSTKRAKKFGKTSIRTEAFCFVISVMDLNKPNTGKDEDDDEDNDYDYVLESGSISVLK
jgi:hypothetical protein